MFLLETLGRLTLSQAGRATPPPVLPRKALGLLAILAAGGPASRDRLMALLWPESDLEHARGSLKKAVHQLRQQLGTSPIRGTELLELDAGVIGSDVARFRAALEQGDLPAAVSAYGGPFLDGIHLQGSVELEHWIDSTRAALQAGWAGAVEQLADRAEAEGEWKVAAARWRKLQDATPADSRLALRLMGALDAAGQAAAALAHAQAHQRALRVVWELPPDAGVEALAGQLRSGTASRRSDVSPPAPAGPVPSGEAPPDRARAGKRRRSRLIAGTAVAGVVLATGAVSAYLGREAGVVGDANLLAVAPFHAADTSLALWRQGLPELLIRALDGAGPLRTVRGPRSLQDWEGPPDREAVARLGSRLRAGLVLYGGVARVGADSVELTAAVFDREADAVVADLGVRGREGRIEELTDSLVVRLLRDMGRGRAIAATRRVSLVARSLPALREFLRGEQFYRRDEVDSALAHYHQAIVEDPGLAMAHRRLAWLIASHLDVGAAYGSWQAELTRAVALNHGLDPRDSLLLLADSLKLSVYQASSADALMRDWFTWVKLLEQAARRFPYDVEIWTEVGEARFHDPAPLSSTLAGALAAFRRAVELDPGYAQGYWHTVELALRLRQPALAARYARDASRLDRDGGLGSMALTSLVLDSGLAAPSSRRAIAAAPPRALLEAGLDHLTWAADSAEAAVAVLREFAGRDDPLVRVATIDPKLRFRFVAMALAFRGHLHAAAATGLARATDPAARAVDATVDPFAELAMLGAVPDSVAGKEFALAFDDSLDWGVPRSSGANPRALRGVPWWYARGDTASLRRFGARAHAVSAAPGGPVARLRGRYYAGIVPAYLALARGDSADALRRLQAVSDSLCLVAACLPEKRLLARLLSASGDDRQAAQVLDRWDRTVLPNCTPSAVLVELERGGIAERLGDTLRARRAYGFVADVWRNADPELQGYVGMAREGIARVGE